MGSSLASANWSGGGEQTEVLDSARIQANGWGTGERFASINSQSEGVPTELPSGGFATSLIKDLIDELPKYNQEIVDAASANGINLAPTPATAARLGLVSPEMFSEPQFAATGGRDPMGLGSALLDFGKAVGNSALGVVEAVPNLLSGALPGFPDYVPFLDKYRTRYDSPLFGTSAEFLTGIGAFKALERFRAIDGAQNTGPNIIIGRDAVNLAEFRRLNVLDADVGRLRPGEAGAAAELQNYLGGTLNRMPPGMAGDFVFSSGPQAGRTVDFMLTPDSFDQATKINRFFEKNLSAFSKTLELHLQKADLVPMDTRFLSERNNLLLNNLINNLSIEKQAKIFMIR